MSKKKSEPTPHSTTTSEIFAAFAAALRSNKSFDNKTVDRLEDALSPGHTINAANLEKALFPRQEDTE